MPATVRIRMDYSALELRRLAAGSKDANQSRRLLSLAAVLDGMGRADAARIGGMDRQTLRDWVHRFNAQGPDGLKDIRSKGQPPRLSREQLAAFAKIVETGPDRQKDGVVRWRRIDLKRVIEERFGVDYHQRTVGKILKQIGFSYSATIWVRGRMASSKMLLRDASLPHLICSRERLENEDDDEADEHGHAQGNDGCGRATL